jgi:hypothetical protein
MMETEEIFETLVFISTLKRVTAREYFSTTVLSLRSPDSAVDIATG